MFQSTQSKIVTLECLLEILDSHRKSGKCIVMTNGCFDLLHAGHVSSIESARELGDVLVVAVNSDASVRTLKGPERPLVPERERAEMLAALAAVDHVVLFEDPSVEETVRKIRPDVLVKAAQYGHSGVVGGGVVEEFGGRVATVPMRDGLSTTKILERIKKCLF